MIDHIREHKQVFPYLCSKELPSSIDHMVLRMIFQAIFINISMDCLSILRKASNPYEIWMSLWKAYGDPTVPPFREDILPPVTQVMVHTTLVEIPPPNALLASSDPVLATYAPDSMR